MTNPRQSDIGRMMEELGRARMARRLKWLEDTGEYAMTPAGVALIRRALQPVVEALKAYLKEALDGTPGKRATAAVILEPLDHEMCVFIALQETLNRAASQDTVWSAGLAVGRHIENEVLASLFETRQPGLYKSLTRMIMDRGRGNLMGAIKASNKEHSVMPPHLWTMSERGVFGTKLVELVVETIPGLKVVTIKSGNRAVHRLNLTPEIETWMREYHAEVLLSRPFYLPLVIPPKRWDDVTGGGYHNLPNGRPLELVARATHTQLKVLQVDQLGPVLRALNTLQETPWRINAALYAIMREAWDRDLQLGALPPREAEAPPPMPPEVINDVRGGPHRKQWRLMMRNLYDKNNRNRGKRFELARALFVASQYLEEDALYFPYRVDFRGRVYPIATSLHPQASDPQRALLQFAEGKPIDDPAAQEWWLIHGANLYGVDKVSLEERRLWTLEHHDNIIASALDPFGNQWWTEADKPWCFLAWCLEYDAWWQSDGSFVSRLPIAMDGSCNGLQHFSAMLRDAVGGGAVNLLPSETPNDIYSRVAERVEDRLKQDVRDDQIGWMASTWLQVGIDRSITKRPVMVLPYGGTYHSCMKYVREAVREKVGNDHPFGTEMIPACTYLSKLVWESISDVVVAARAAMDWLQEVARVTNKYKIPLQWVTPSGFTVHQAYRNVRRRRVKTRFRGNLVYFSVTDNLDSLDGGRQINAISPNFVHSLDAAALVATVNTARAAGIHSFAMIHDSYGTHAADTPALASILRQEFVNMYDRNVLQDFRNQILAQLPEKAASEIPPVPPYGTLDLSRVMESPYFFA